MNKIKEHSELNLNKLKQMRKQNLKTVRELGELLGIGATGYFKKELGDRKFTLKEAKILADFYKITMEELFFK